MEVVGVSFVNTVSRFGMTSMEFPDLGEFSPRVLRRRVVDLSLVNVQPSLVCIPSEMRMTLSLSLSC